MVTTKKTVTKYTPKEMRKGLKHFTAKKKKKSNTEEHNLGNEGPENLEGM